MDFMSLHLLKMQERRKYKEDRQKADILSNLIVFGILVFCALVNYLRFIGG
jgi:hypothetical protein